MPTLKNKAVFLQSLKKRFKAFSLIEVLVALGIISIAVTATVAIFSNALRYMSSDKMLNRAVFESNAYFSRLYTSVDLKKSLFNPSEISNLSQRTKWPLLMKPLEKDLTNNMKMLINRKIRRWTPLLADIGVEIIWESNDKKGNKRHYWIESTISEKYLESLK